MSDIQWEALCEGETYSSWHGDKYEDIDRGSLRSFRLVDHRGESILSVPFSGERLVYRKRHFLQPTKGIHDVAYLIAKDDEALALLPDGSHLRGVLAKDGEQPTHEVFAAVKLMECEG